MARRLIVALALPFALAACGDDHVDFSGLEPKLSSLQPKVFDASCVDSGRHSASDAAGDLVLDSGKSYAQMVGVKSHRKRASGYYIVEAGNPDNSTLYVYLIGDKLGKRMPQGTASVARQRHRGGQAMDRRRGAEQLMPRLTSLILAASFVASPALARVAPIVEAPTGLRIGSNLQLLAQNEGDPEFDPFLAPVELDAAMTAEWDRQARRRKMLRWHQGLSLTAFGLLTAQTVVGQLYWNKLQGLGSTDRLRMAHKVLGFTSFATYALAAPLAIFAPDAAVDREGFDPMNIHRGLAFVHGAGMAIMPFFGLYIVAQKTKADTTEQQINTLRVAHLATGYVTWAAMAGAYLALMID